MPQARPALPALPALRPPPPALPVSETTFFTDVNGLLESVASSDPAARQRQVAAASTAVVGHLAAAAHLVEMEASRHAVEAEKAVGHQEVVETAAAHQEVEETAAGHQEVAEKAVGHQEDRQVAA